MNFIWIFSYELHMKIKSKKKCFFFVKMIFYVFIWKRSIFSENLSFSLKIRKLKKKLFFSPQNYQHMICIWNSYEIHMKKLHMKCIWIFFICNSYASFSYEKHMQIILCRFCIWISLCNSYEKHMLNICNAYDNFSYEFHMWHFLLCMNLW